jgi:hypothetical protein
MMLRACCVVHAPVGFAVTPATYASRGEFDEDEYVQAPQQYGVDGEEVARDDPGRLRAQNERQLSVAQRGAGSMPACA